MVDTTGTPPTVFMPPAVTGTSGFATTLGNFVSETGIGFYPANLNLDIGAATPVYYVDHDAARSARTCLDDRIVASRFADSPYAGSVVANRAIRDAANRMNGTVVTRTMTESSLLLSAAMSLRVRALSERDTVQGGSLGKKDAVRLAAAASTKFADAANVAHHSATVFAGTPEHRYMAARAETFAHLSALEAFTLAEELRVFNTYVTRAPREPDLETIARRETSAWVAAVKGDPQMLGLVSALAIAIEHRHYDAADELFHLSGTHFARIHRPEIAFGEYTRAALAKAMHSFNSWEDRRYTGDVLRLAIDSARRARVDGAIIARLEAFREAAVQGLSTSPHR
jgi:hypothetical protein